jgi:hypothetical protein
MEDHRATYVRLRELVCARFPDDELAAEIAVREAFDAKETTAYTPNLDALVEEQDILEAAHMATSLREELHEELRKKGPDNNDDYVHLDDDNLDTDDLFDLPDNTEAKEAAAKQRALMASFKT